jgi:hypothetical protein
MTKNKAQYFKIGLHRPLRFGKQAVAGAASLDAGLFSLVLGNLSSILRLR